MIEIEMNDNSVMKFHSSDYTVENYKGWLYVYKKLSSGKDLKHLIPMSSIRLVSFD